jgi:transcriptional regulator of arginine metabolism
VSRRERERALLEIVQGARIETQDDLVKALRRRGLDVTQATVSRDVKRLGLIKIADRGGGYRYGPPGAAATAPPPPAATEHLRAVFSNFVTALDAGEAILLVKTLSGHANAVAIAIDDARLPAVAGTVAGDDTILVVVRKASDHGAVRRALESLFH